MHGIVTTSNGKEIHWYLRTTTSVDAYTLKNGEVTGKRMYAIHVDKNGMYILMKPGKAYLKTWKS